MHRDVQRAEPLKDETAPLCLGQVGESREVAVEERIPKVVVFFVQAAPKAGGHPADEAELTAVVATLHRIEYRCFELDAEVFVRILVGGEDESRAAAHEVELDPIGRGV